MKTDITGIKKTAFQILRYCLAAYVAYATLEGIHNRIQRGDRNYSGTAVGIGIVYVLVSYRPISPDVDRSAKKATVQSASPHKDLPTETSVGRSKKVNRPYIKFYVDKLEGIAESNWNNNEVLKDLDYELGFRSRKKASVLRKKIAKKLDHLNSPEFKWPTTDAGESSQPLSDDSFRYEEGVLKTYGYKVGMHGIRRAERIDILNSVFLYSLVPIKDSSYEKEWGEPKTAQRLKKIADSIAAFTRNAKRRNRENFSQAIQDWESDLAYLKRRYYDDTFSFTWPRT